MSSNCLLCFNEFIQENVRIETSLKLSEICRKYLFFVFKEKESSHEDLSFCPKCFESAKELVHFNEQIEYYQQKISELILSLEILHRNQKIVDTDCKMDADDNHSEKESTDFDKESQIVTSKDMLTDNFEDSLVLTEVNNEKNIADVTFVELKCETNQQHFIDETSNPEWSIEKGNEVKCTSEVEIKQERNQSSGSQEDIIVVESDKRFSNDKRSIWTKINSAIQRYKLNKSSSSSKNCIKNFQSPPIPVSTATPSNSAIIDVDGALNDSSEIGSEKPQCNICQKEFKCERNLFRHQIVHQDDPPHRCDVCEKGFRHANDLLQHKRIHTGERPYKCDVCKQTFTQRGTFYNHQRTHSRERPHKCDICKRKFSCKGSVVRHRRRHTGEKPFKCDECDYAGSRSCDLKSHRIQRHSPLSNFKCRECQQGFILSTDVETHYKRVHFALDFSDDCVIKTS